MINLFPTPINLIKNPNHSQIRDRYINHCLNIPNQVPPGGQDWISKNVLNTFGTYSLWPDPVFKQLNTWIIGEVKKFKDNLGFGGGVEHFESWLNIYKKNYFQEWHNHNFALISAIYYLKTDKDSAKTWFKTPIPENPNKPIFNENNPYTWEKYSIDQEEGTLILFRSDLNHCVEAHPTDSVRITLAYNFKKN
jgi:uncharacterized protein (TIGR02466 family)